MERGTSIFELIQEKCERWNRLFSPGGDTLGCCPSRAGGSSSPKIGLKESLLVVAGEAAWAETVRAPHMYLSAIIDWFSRKIAGPIHWEPHQSWWQ